MNPCTMCKKEAERFYTLYFHSPDGEKVHQNYCISCIKKNRKSFQDSINSGKWSTHSEEGYNFIFYNREQRIEKKLESIVGMKEVKTKILDWTKQLKGEKKLKEKSTVTIEPQMMHMVITGPSGTGKTMLAKVLTDILFELNLIKKRKCIEVSRVHLVGQHVGLTAIKTMEKIEEAAGGVLFVDEAYTLNKRKESGNDFGHEALETLLLEMEKRRGEFVVIFAGYPVEMEEFLACNEGLASRVPIQFHLHDYTPEEVSQILSQELKRKHYDLTEVEEAISTFVAKKAKNGVVAGNGRYARNMAESIISQHMKRISEETESENIEKIKYEDLENVFCPKEDLEKRKGLDAIQEEALAELQGLIGMETLKTHIKKIARFESVQKQKIEAGLPVHSSSLHMFFKGNPGTGKTTVARIIGKFFRGLGILSNGHFVEMSKQDLLNGTDEISARVKRFVNKAKGGVLFIDEAYSLANDGQGKEILDTLVKEMEDNREDQIVIMAGYPKEMEKLFTLNPGLRSRIAYELTFEDYKADELFGMLQQLVEGYGLRLQDEAKMILVEQINMMNEKQMIHGNGRWVRNFFEKIIMSQSNRIFEMDSKDLTTIDVLDVVDALREIQKEAVSITFKV